MRRSPGCGDRIQTEIVLTGGWKAAVDPSSPLTGGAVLGDRFRMSEHAGDPGVFVRSVASRGHLGRLSVAALRMIDAFDAAGQSEVEVAQIADTTVVVCAPGAGDEVQALKAGILEVANALVVNKAHPLAERTVSQLRGAVALRGGTCTEVPVLSTIATDASGVPELAETLLVQSRAHADPRARRRRRVSAIVAQFAANRIRRQAMTTDNERYRDLCETVLDGRLGLEDAARQWVSTSGR